MPTPTFQLSLLGRFELAGPDGAIDLTSKKLAALLAFLACTAPQAHGRDKLMTLLWGSHFDAQARQNLRQALTRLRRVLGEDALISSGESVSLQPGVIACDVPRFEALLADGSRDALNEAVGFYRGRLLPDIEIPEEAWTEWLTAERQRLEGLALDAMVKLGEQELEARDHEPALIAANRVIAISGLREDAHRLIMRVLAAGGRRADALKHYEDLTALLKRELAVEPDPTTRSLAAELRRPHTAQTRLEARSDPAPEKSAVLLPLPDRPTKSESGVLAPTKGMPSNQSRLASGDTNTDYRPSLAVLPFRTLQNDESDAYFAEGVIDDIIRALDGLKDLVVISRSSTQPFARAPLDLRRVGNELDVRYALHGSVRRSGEVLRIAAELCETQTGQVLWADRFDGKTSELFDLQDLIALRVATSIAPHLRQRELIRVRRKHPESMTAYDLTLQALHLILQLDRTSIVRARTLLEQAIAHDPDYALAHSHMASLRMKCIGQGWSEDEMADRTMAANAAELAIARDGNDALALAIYGHLKSYLLKDYSTGRDYLERALAVGPSCAWAWGYSSLTYGYLGDYTTAIVRAEQAVRRSPIGPDAFLFESFLCQAYYLAGRFEDAVTWGRKSAAHSSTYASNLLCLIASLVAFGEIQEAPVLAEQLLRFSPTFRLSAFRSRTPLRGGVRDLFVERLHQAGVPD